MAEDAYSAEAARSAAEARRKRILEKADKRMGVVSGEQAQDEEEVKQSSARAARLRAARQKRYGKKKTETSESKKEETPALSTSEKVEDSKAATEAVTTETMAVNPEESSPDESIAQEEAVGVQTAPSSAGKEPDESPEEPKKKYVGVAKMRRQMIMKKKLAEAEDTKKSQPRPNKGEVGLPLKPLSSQVASLPIYMHIVTILLLFLAGLDVGVQQYHEDVKVHNDLALKEYGIPLIHRNLWNKKTRESDLNLLDVETPLPAGEILKDEFEEDLDQEDTVPNIDPLFRVDFDELTKGPGLLFQLARGAIYVHRLVLMVVYYAPLSILQTLAGIPRALVQTPPALCLLALVLRQIVGKIILKAGIPVRDVEEKDSAIDVLAMAKQYVTKFLSSAFPTAVGLYDAFVHLRSDMYIVICGLFCGMAWTHMSQYAGTHVEHESLASGGTDEL